MFRCLGHRRVVTVLALVSVLLGLVGLNPGTAVVHTEKYTYDALTVSRVEHHATTTLSGESSEGTSSSADSRERSSMASDTSTTLVAPVVATEAVRYGPHNIGPLADNIASTFRSGSYTAEVLQSETTLYRVYGGQSGPVGSYLSRTAPSGPLQAQIDSALNPAWGTPLRTSQLSGFLRVRPSMTELLLRSLCQAVARSWAAAVRSTSRRSTQIGWCREHRGDSQVRQCVANAGRWRQLEAPDDVVRAPVRRPACPHRSVRFSRATSARTRRNDASDVGASVERGGR